MAQLSIMLSDCVYELYIHGVNMHVQACVHAHMYAHVCVFSYMYACVCTCTCIPICGLCISLNKLDYLLAQLQGM